MKHFWYLAFALAACGDDAKPAVEHLAILEGTLSAPATARATHDGGAMAAEASATASGDIGHIVGLGASILGTAPDRWVALDRWARPDNIDAYYAGPELQQGLSALVGTPSITQLRREPTWYGWGDFDTASDAPRWYVLVRGHLRDVATAHANADMGAMAAEPTATSLGDVAHIVFTGRDDAADFVAIDIWTRPDDIATFYTQLAQSAAALFSEPPTVTVLHATDWYQWGADGKTTLDGVWQITAFTCNAKTQPIGDFKLEIRASGGTFIQVFDPACVATYDESYTYPTPDQFQIDAHSIVCDPSARCPMVIGAACLPTPPPTTFAWTVDHDALRFTRTATGPGDLPCQPGDAVDFEMQRHDL